MPQNNYPPSADMVIRDLQQRIAKLEAAAQTRVAQDTITGGALQVQDAAANTYAYIGKLGANWPDGSPQYGFTLYRQSGPEAVGFPVMDLFTADPAHAAQTMSMYDASGNLTYNDDAVSGTGLGRPYMPFPMCPAPQADWPSTSATSFTDLWFSWPPWQSPKIYLQGWATTSGTAVGQLQVISGSTVVGSPVSINGLTFWTVGPAAWSSGGFYCNPTDVRIQAKVTSGSGTISVGVGSSYGCQS